MSSNGSKTIVITGASSGIGAATAKRFLEAGAEVHNFDLINKGAPEGCITHVVDVRDWAAIDSAVATVEGSYGPISVAIANAGISRRRNVLDVDHASMAEVLSINLLGVFALWRSCARAMVSRDGGVLLATASTNGTAGYPYYADYNASKAGVLALCRSFALELSPKVRVACVSPGYVMTPMQRLEYSDEMLAEVNTRIPMGRHASPAEIAEAFFFLASEAADFITGQALTVDGGELAGGTASSFSTVVALGDQDSGSQGASTNASLP